MILVIDNYDSFVHNLARYVRRVCDQPTLVVRNDDVVLDDKSLAPKAIIISPGPCGPRQAGKTLEIIERFHKTIPILGVCLGHQAIIEFFGGNVVLADAPVHGRVSTVHLNGTGQLFEAMPQEFSAGRYHSLIGQSETMPDDLLVTAETDDGTIMAIEHNQLPIFGVQFHPESILTEFGYQILYNFFVAAKLNPTMPTNTVELAP